MSPWRERTQGLGAAAFVFALFAAAVMVYPTQASAQTAVVADPCAGNKITASVVVLDNPTVFNRLGAQNPNWITYALRRDVVLKSSITAGGVSYSSDTPLTLLPATVPGDQLAGNVRLRRDKRTRPLVVRSVEGACLSVNFQNLLDPRANPNNPQDREQPIGGNTGLNNDDQVAGRCAGFHASGAELVDSVRSDGSLVGVNHPNANVVDNCADQTTFAISQDDFGGLVAPGKSITYNLFTPHEGAYVVNSYGATLGSEQGSGNLGMGMFAALNVEPKDSKIYRSQVTEEELRLATVGVVPDGCAGTDLIPNVTCNPGGQPIIDYEKTYPTTSPWVEEGKAGLPILNMLTPAGELVHSDINAIIVGPNDDGSFPPSTYPLESAGKANPVYPNRLEPFREFTSVFHDEVANSQVFPRWYGDPVLHYTLVGVKDAFMINYGSGGIGSEIIANRLRTGPMHDCTGCAYEEFFLASQTVGDPGLLVKFPANTLIEQCNPTNIAAGPGDPEACWRLPTLENGPIRFPVAFDANGDPTEFQLADNYALFQEDPSNVHHSYTGDFAKIRNTHAGAFEQHIFHLHNHQWVINPNDDNANYLDAQEIMPGSGHTYELVNGGAGNRNKTAGDAIFHCHFYPHFAQGMWYHIRIQDVFERGSVLAVSNADDPQNPTTGFHTTPFALRSGKPAAGARALPDGELPDGVPIPAIVPMPGKPMPPMPAKVEIVAVDRGGFSLLGGRRAPDGIPDSGQALVDRASVAGADGELFTADDVSPGFPFFLAGNECGVPIPPDPIAGTPGNPCPMGTTGQRMPTPPLDLLTEQGAAAIKADWKNLGGGWDGGLPRHTMLGYVSGGLSLDTQNRLDFRKVVELAQPVYFPEIGTDMERVSMNWHSVRKRPSAANNLLGAGTTSGAFIMNGAPPVPGGPFQDPCIDDEGDIMYSGVTGDWFDGADIYPDTLGTRGGSFYGSDNPRTYKIANVQIDAVFNKLGHHYPQERIIALWEDVAPTVNKHRPPEPLVMRFNSFDCGKLLHANLVPAEYELDDFQVRTPTDIIGQHIHLPKWDLTTNDGAANGWNYEDGTLSPGIVRERIHAINEFNHFAGTIVGPNCTLAAALAGDTTACPLPGQLGPMDLSDLVAVPTIDTGDAGSAVGAGLTTLTALAHPFFGSAPGNNPQTGDYLGARTTIQRILVDPVVNVAGVDRGLGLTFSHDHYGPSTFQQIGLYSTILAEPAGSTWKHNETGVALNTRDDGGPTSWQAIIETPATAEVGSTVQSETIPDHREFYFEMSDFQHTYLAGTYVGADAQGRPKLTVIDQPDPFDATRAFAPGIQNEWVNTINPPLKLKSIPFPDVVTAEALCPGPLADAAGNPIPGSHTNASPFVPRPCAEAINISHSAIWVVNYRNEPVGQRVFDPNGFGPDRKRGTQALGLAGDLAFAFQSRTDRRIAALNTSLGNTPYPAVGTGDGINRDRRPGDPYTPIMRTYERDDVKIKIQVGATEEQHQATVHGIKWLSNGSGFGASPNSGWRNFQSHGISEQFTLQTPMIPDPGQVGDTVDYLYATDATRPGLWLGTWGILRTYGTPQKDLVALEDRPAPGTVKVDTTGFNGVCPSDAPLREYSVTAVAANQILRNSLGATIPFNFRGDSNGDGIGDNVGGPLNPRGGTLVYNRRGTNVPDVVIPAEGNEPATVIPGGDGPLHDPTALMYVRTEDMVHPDRAFLGLKPGAPVEPLVLRANAGECIKVTLRNRLPGRTPDLAGWQDMMWGVTRRIQNDPVTGLPEMHFFNNNLIRPSSFVGLHAQLVEYDASKDDGVLVGQNNQLAAGPVRPGGQKTYTWYAGDLREEPNDSTAYDLKLVARPVEFGGTNLLSTDRIKQPQKGMFGALVIEPEGAKWPDALATLEDVPDGQGRGFATRKTRAQVTVDAPEGDAGSGGVYREALTITHKTGNLRWKDGRAVKNIHQGELGREGAEDSGHAGYNYGTEPSWFRFQLPPDVPFGNAGAANSFGAIQNAHAQYSNTLVAGEPNAVPAIAGVSEAGDPATPVFRATAGQASRMHVLSGASADRDSTFILHGHVWQRDPYVCTGDSQDKEVLLPGRCAPDAPVASMALGVNPQGKYMGGEEGTGFVYGYWPVLFNAGGTFGVTGDYLFRDYGPSGNRNGMMGILRVQKAAATTP